MRKYKDSVIDKKKVCTVICNSCGKVIEQNRFGYFDEHMTIEKTWEFGSEFDGETHSIDLCQCCYKKLLLSLKISPISHDKNSFSNFLPL